MLALALYPLLFVSGRRKGEIGLPSGDLPVFTFDDEYLWEIHLSSILHQVVRVYLDSEGVITFPHRANGESGLLDDASVLD